MQDKDGKTAQGGSMTRQQAEQEMEQLRKVFPSVRMLTAEQVQAGEAVGDAARQTLEEKTTHSRMEYRGQELYEVTALFAQVEGTPCTVMSLPCQRAVQPAPCKSSTLVSTSARCGTCRKRTVPLHKRAAASSGSTLFLAAGMCTVPFSGMPPVMIRSPPMQKAPVPQKIPHAMRREGFLFILSAVVPFVCPVICS